MARPDPRVDPVSEPPKNDEEESFVQRVGARRVAERRAQEKKPDEAKADAKDRDEEKSDEPKGEPVRDGATDERAPKKVTSSDPRYEALEKLLDRNDWAGIGKELGSFEDVGRLPPNLGLIAALARSETSKEADPEVIALAIRCMAGLLHITEESPIARVLARRVLRKNPVRLVDRKAPPARVSLLIIVVTLALGGGVGWLLSAGSWRGATHLLHLL